MRNLRLLSILFFVAQPRLFESHNAKLHHKHMHTLRARNPLLYSPQPALLKVLVFQIFDVSCVELFSQTTQPFNLYSILGNSNSTLCVYVGMDFERLGFEPFHFLCENKLKNLDLHSTAPCKTCLKLKIFRSIAS